MKIIELSPLKNGAHRNMESSGITKAPAGWAVIPDELEIPNTFPFVDVDASDGVVTKLTAGVMPEPESKPEPEPETGDTEARLKNLESEMSLLQAAIAKGVGL